jgi:hypothetical protein
MVKTRSVVQTRTHAQKYFQKLSKQVTGGENGTISSSIASKGSIGSMPFPDDPHSFFNDDFGLVAKSKTSISKSISSSSSSSSSTHPLQHSQHHKKSAKKINTSSKNSLTYYSTDELLRMPLPTVNSTDEYQSIHDSESLSNLQDDKQSSLLLTSMHDDIRIRPQVSVSLLIFD